MTHSRGLFFVLLALSLFIASPLFAGAPVPTPAQQDAAFKLLKDIYKAQYTDTTSAGRKNFAAELITEAARAGDDAAGRYVMLREALALATQANDSKLAFQSIEQLTQGYAIDAAAMKLQALSTLLPRANAEETAALAARGVDLLEEALAAENSAVASKVVPAISFAVRRGGDDSLKSRFRDLQAALADFEKAKTALDKLKTDPDDPAANLAAGRYYCFAKNNLEKGLPLLVLSSDPKLKSIATADQSNPDAPATQKELADMWYDYAQSQTASAKARCLARAADWYRKALPGLTGLTKIAVDRRISQIGPAESSAASSAAPDLKVGQWIDVIKTVELPADCISGQWRRNGNALVASAPELKQRLVLPVLPEGDYDMQVVFTRNTGEENVAIIFPVASRQVALLLGGWITDGANNRTSGLHSIDNKDPRFNPTGVPNSALANGTQYTVDLHVRIKDQDAEIKAEVNDKPILQWHGPQSSLTGIQGWDFNKRNIPCLGASAGQTTFSSARIKMISGKITPLRQTLPLKAGEWFDLLKRFNNPETQAIRGDWKLDAPQLKVISDRPDQRIGIPGDVSGAYDLQLKFIRNSGDGDIGVIFPVGRRLAHVALSAYAGGVSALSLHGRPFNESPAAVHPGTLENGREYTLDIRVIPDGDNASLRIALDGKPYITWNGAQSDLTVWENTRLPADRKFGLATFNSKATFTAFRIRAADAKP